MAFWRWYDRASRVDFAGTLLGLLFDWKTWFVGAGGAVVSLLVSAYGPWTPGQVWLAALIGGACIAIIYMAIVLFVARRTETSTQSRNVFGKDGQVSLLFESQRAHLPEVVPVEGIIYTIDFFRFDGGARTFSLGERYGKPGEKWNWHPFKMDSYRCTVTNYGSEPLFNVLMPMRVQFRERTAAPENPRNASSGKITFEGDWHLFITKLEPGKPFVFYATSQSNEFVTAMPPTTATYLRAGSEDSESAKLLPAKDFLSFVPVDPTQRVEIPRETPAEVVQRRAKLIRDAREFVVAATARTGVNTDFKKKLESFVPFFELRPHLSANYLEKLDAPRTVYVPRDGTRLPALASWFLDELERLEKEWGLR